MPQGPPPPTPPRMPLRASHPHARAVRDDALSAGRRPVGPPLDENFGIDFNSQDRIDENFGIDFNSQDRMFVRSPSGWRSEADRPVAGSAGAPPGSSPARWLAESDVNALPAR